MKLLSSLLGLYLLVLLGTPVSAMAQKEAYVQLKCNRCHAISAQGIEKKAEAKGADEEEEDEEEEKDSPDLSHVGKFHNAVQLQAYMTKTAAHEPHEGLTSTKKHKLKFKGTDAELKGISEWLASLK